MRSGQDKNIVDPDRAQIYTKRKKRQRFHVNSSGATALPSKSTVQPSVISVTFPSEGWSSSLARMSMFTRAEMYIHISKSGKVSIHKVKFTRRRQA